MSSHFDPGALMARFYELPSGPRVCLRLARTGDRTAIRALFVAQSLPLDDLSLTRLTAFDPRQRLVICATALLRSSNTVVGVGAVDLRRGRGALPTPDPVVADEALAPGLTELLTDALTGRAEALARHRAA